MEVKLLDHTKLSNAVIGARTCWNSFHKGGNYDTPTDDITDEDKELLKRLIYKNQHLSIAEHCQILCLIKDCFILSWFKNNNFSFVDNFKVLTNLRVLIDNKEELHLFIQEIIPQKWLFLFEDKK